MSARTASLLAVAWLATSPAAVGAATHAAVIFTRTGERTPLSALDPAELTPLGAQQAYSQGSIFRQRYVMPESNDIDRNGPAQIQNISEYSVMDGQMYALAADTAYTVATAQAFMQGLYPPFTLNQSSAPMLDSESVLANASYIEAPLDGYQYARIRTASGLDPNSIYVAGQDGCVNYALDSNNYFYSSEFNETQARTSGLYHDVGVATLSDVFPEASWGYLNAYSIFDHLNYGYMHDADINAILSNNITLRGAFDQLRWLSDQQQWALNSVADSNDQIRAIAGKTLAAEVLGLLAANVVSSGASRKLSLLFGEFEPFVSFFSLASLAKSDSSNFYGLPGFASSMVFELFSYDSGSSNGPYPNSDDLWVRFYFRNGTDDSSHLIAYPLFGRGPSETEMRWSEFQTLMGSIMLGEVSDWCDTCNAGSIFCPAFNLTLTSGTVNPNMTPQVAGVIGAGVALGVALLAFLALIPLAGVRLHRADSHLGGCCGGKRRKSELGGFKGNAKLASDADVNLVKNGAPFGIAIMERQENGQGGQQQEPGQPRERVGSWEMSDGKITHLSGSTAVSDVQSRRSSLDIYEGAMAKPVNPHERV